MSIALLVCISYPSPFCVVIISYIVARLGKDNVCIMKTSTWTAHPASADRSEGSHTVCFACACMCVCVCCVEFRSSWTIKRSIVQGRAGPLKNSRPPPLGTDQIRTWGSGHIDVWRGTKPRHSKTRPPPLWTDIMGCGCRAAQRSGWESCSDIQVVVVVQRS